ncbi:transmembrane protein 80 isoform X2 [Rissa tridactyla]|uniref:transmembrane protein 80 isoform X2 n=1 Tax=Rissa tridactyla TaxID=75485 RepID=UPI0023BABDC7|nr:transmembrane protein 80 isoform X2 [Rissa tridactyla]
MREAAEPSPPERGPKRYLTDRAASPSPPERGRVPEAARPGGSKNPELVRVFFRSHPKAAEAAARGAERCRVRSDRARIPLRRPERAEPESARKRPNRAERSDRTRRRRRGRGPPRKGCWDAGGPAGAGRGAKMAVVRRGEVFSYPDDFLAPDLALLFVMAILEVLRLYLGSKGNLTEEEAPLGLSLVMTVGSVILSVYFLVWQTYVLKADVILNALLLFTYGLESLLKVVAIAAFVS